MPFIMPEKGSAAIASDWATPSIEGLANPSQSQDFSPGTWQGKAVIGRRIQPLWSTVLSFRSSSSLFQMGFCICNENEASKALSHVPSSKSQTWLSEVSKGRGYRRDTSVLVQCQLFPTNIQTFVYAPPSFLLTWCPLCHLFQRPFKLSCMLLSLFDLMSSCVILPAPPL